MEKAIYQKEFYIGTEKADCSRQIGYRQLMVLFQAMATEHADVLGFGFNDMQKYNYSWVITKIKFCFLDKIPYSSTIRIVSWPLQPKRLFGERDFEIYIGEKLVGVAISSWSLIDLGKRSLVSTDCIKDLPINYCENRSMQDLTYSRVVFDDDFKFSYSKTIRLSDIDMNEHVNNTLYMSFAIDTLTFEEYSLGIKEFDLRFNRELTLNNKVDLYRKKQDNAILVVAKNGEEVVFSAVIKLK